VLSFIWLFSIGRTVLFQNVWKLRMEALAGRHPGDGRFEVLSSKVDLSRLPIWVRLAGAVSSKVYLVGAPILFAAAWSAVLIFTLAAG